MMQFSKEAQALAKDTVEAIKTIAQRQEKECPKCLGLHYRIACDKCNDTGKVKGKWEWEPEEWDEVTWDQGWGRITDLKYHGATITEIEPNKDSQHVIMRRDVNKFIPLLHWERIKEILEGMGYRLDVKRFEAYESNRWVATVETHKIQPVAQSGAYESRQLAVMQAVVELGKEHT